MSERAVPRYEARDIEFLDICRCGCGRMTSEIARTLDQAARRVVSIPEIAAYRPELYADRIRQEFYRLSERA